MNTQKSLEGGCLCGAVRFVASRVEPDHHACHCSMCRRWGGAPFLGIHCGAVEFRGLESLHEYSSSDWAARGFCQSCGSNLYYRSKQDGHFSMCAGAFDDQSGFRLVSEIFIDRKPPNYEFAGEHERMTEKEVYEKYGVTG